MQTALPVSLHSQHSGAAFPVAVWSGSDALVLTWHVRWAAAGLTAIKPVVIFAQDFLVDAGKAVELSQAGPP